MSDLIPKNDPCLGKSQSEDLASQCPLVSRLIVAREKDLGGFSVRRLLPMRHQRMIGPWIFFDHMGPAKLEPGQGIDVRPHPHINLATVTYLFEGEIWHQDSIGNNETIQPGAINLMVAGKGIVHSERTRPEVRATGQSLNGLQLWLALPEEDEEIDPAFYHYDTSEIPETKVGTVPVRVMMGEAYGLRSPVLTFKETLYIEARLQPGDELVLPNTPERALYCVQGKVRTTDQEIPEYSMAVLQPDREVVVTALEESLISLIGGAPLGERFMEWNFVSSRKERLARAREDWVARRFDLIPADREEFIPYPN